MSGTDHRHDALARIYAEALLAITGPAGTSAALLGELEELARFLDAQPELAAVLASPLVEAGARQALVEKLFRGRASDLLVDTLQVLRRRDRLALVGDLARAYRAAHREREGILELEVTTAVPISAELRERMIEGASARFGKRIELRELIDPALIGGLVARAGDLKLDGSVRSDLARAGARLRQRGSEEIHRDMHLFIEQG
jgi:F-type H+-transporting ATPase subunit delta